MKRKIPLPNILENIAATFSKVHRHLCHALDKTFQHLNTTYLKSNSQQSRFASHQTFSSSQTNFPSFFCQHIFTLLQSPMKGFKSSMPTCPSLRNSDHFRAKKPIISKNQTRPSNFRQLVLESEYSTTYIGPPSRR